MKKAIIPIMILGTYSANAAVLPTAGGGHYYQATRTPTYAQARIPTKAKKPTRFYINAKGGYNLMYGWLYTDEDSDAGFTFSKGSPIFSGSVGVDLNYDPSLRIEFEVAHISPSKVKFDDDWDSKLHADVGYTGYVINFIPYFKMGDSVNFDLIIGLGAASMSFSDSDEYDYLNMESGDIAFAANIGIGLDIKVSDNISFTPEARYRLLLTTIKYDIDIPYIGHTELKDNTFLMHNFQFMAGIKYTF